MTYHTREDFPRILALANMTPSRPTARAVTPPPRNNPRADSGLFTVNYFHAGQSGPFLSTTIDLDEILGASFVNGKLIFRRRENGVIVTRELTLDGKGYEEFLTRWHRRTAARKNVSGKQPSGDVTKLINRDAKGQIESVTEVRL